MEILGSYIISWLNCLPTIDFSNHILLAFDQNFKQKFDCFLPLVFPLYLFEDLESDNTTKVESSASDSEIPAERESKKFISRSKVVKSGTPSKLCYYALFMLVCYWFVSNQFFHLLASQNKWRRRRKSHSTSSSDDNVKRIKVDPDFTPRKYTEAVFELQRRQSTIKRISSLNVTLQEKLLLEETKNADLQKEIDALRASMASCKCKQACEYLYLCF